LEFAATSVNGVGDVLPGSTPQSGAHSSSVAATRVIGEGGVPIDERIRCVCQIYEVTPESGRMLRCGRCQSWQHSSCFILPEDEDDDSYLCYICSHPPGIRDSKRRLEEVETYLTTGELARFPTPKKTTMEATKATPFTLSTAEAPKPPMTYGKNEAAAYTNKPASSSTSSATSSSNSLDTLAAVNLRGSDSQVGFFKAVGQSVNNVCAGIHRLNDCLHGTGLRMHQLKKTLESRKGEDVDVGGGKTDAVNATEGLTCISPPVVPSTTIQSEATELDEGEPTTMESQSSKANPRSSLDSMLAAESARIDADHDAMEARLAAMEAEMDEIERLWDESEEFVSLPPGKKVAVVGETTNLTIDSRTAPTAGGSGNTGELENQFRIKRALRGLIEDLNQVQQIAFHQTVKQN